jgi:hypothetical protein
MDLELLDQGGQVPGRSDLLVGHLLLRALPPVLPPVATFTGSSAVFHGAHGKYLPPFWELSGRQATEEIGDLVCNQEVGLEGGQ